MRKIIAAFTLLLSAFAVYASRVDTISIRSNAMNKGIKAVTIVPEKALEGQRCPVVYLLNGYSNNHRSWLMIKPCLREYSDRYGIIFVCPDGQNSWYWDSPNNPTSMLFETFISKELIEYIDANLPTIADRKARAITGLSMGGHGALWNAIRHKDVFGAAGSTSGGVDIRPFPDKWEMKKQLGEYKKNKKVWDDHTVINQLDDLKNGELALIIDCGYDDFFFQVNNNLHNKLLERKIGHDYLTRPGAHNWKYWNNSIDYQLLFFDKFFHQK
jgi:Predicted esterase